MNVQSCCFANLNLLLFCRSCCRRPGRCLSSPLFTDNPWAFVFTISYMMSAVFSILQYVVVQSLRSSWSCWCAPTVSPVAGNSGPGCCESWTTLGIRENNCAVQWIKIYPMDSLIHLLKKWGQISKIFKIVRAEFLILFTVAEISLISFCFPLKKRTELAILITNWDQSYTVVIPREALNPPAHTDSSICVLLHLMIPNSAQLLLNDAV